MNPKREYFDALAAGWDALPAPPDAAARAERFVRGALRPEDRWVLDAGCGTGILVGAIAGVRPVEFDFAEAMLRENRRKWVSRAGGWVCGDALRPPFGPVFDCVLCFGILPHLGGAEKALHALRTCLRRGGAIAIGHMMSSNELNEFHSQLDGPVNQDHILPADELCRVIEGMGGRITGAEESAGWYFVRAEF